jgi:hypothetical protein
MTLAINQKILWGENMADQPIRMDRTKPYGKLRRIETNLTFRYCLSMTPTSPQIDAWDIIEQDARFVSILEDRARLHKYRKIHTQQPLRSALDIFKNVISHAPHHEKLAIYSGAHDFEFPKTTV